MSEEQKSQGIEIPIDWESPHAPVVFSDSVVVRNTGHEFILYFYQVLPPLLVGTPEQQEEQIKKIDALKAFNVASVMIAPTRIPELIRLLQRNHENYQNEKKSIASSEE